MAVQHLKTLVLPDVNMKQVVGGKIPGGAPFQDV